MIRHVATLGVVAFAIWFGFEPSPAIAQAVPGKPDAKRGLEVAAKLCSNCHAGKGIRSQSGGQQADVPTFFEIAKRPGQTVERIHGVLVMPRHPMPAISLTQNEMADLAAYILSHKQGD